jgi:hypothetical protein
VYEREYTAAEVLARRARFDRYATTPERYAECQRFSRVSPWYREHPRWVRRRLLTASIWATPDDAEAAAASPRVAAYVARRRQGGRFPPIVVTRAHVRPGSRWNLPPQYVWVARDGNHRTLAAQVVGDQYIDAFVPVDQLAAG